LGKSSSGSGDKIRNAVLTTTPGNQELIAAVYNPDKETEMVDLYPMTIMMEQNVVVVRTALPSTLPDPDPDPPPLPPTTPSSFDPAGLSPTTGGSTTSFVLKDESFFHIIFILHTL
uniref:RanBD1 domain-containing protein n=1 Tax=Hymenolepis diminuta TaxID=6216 RepID=A0A0R3SZF1_HYMDI